MVRDDVQISFKAGDKVRKGGLTVGYTGYGGSSHIGPEMGFGFVMGDYLQEPVLLIKTAWGGNPSYCEMGMLIFRDSHRWQTAQSNRLQIPLNEPDGARLGM